MELCRACLSSEKEIVPLDEKFIVNYNLLTNLHVQMSDGLPQFICCSCFDTVQLFIIFREKSHTSETTLREVLVSHIKCEETFTDDMCYDHDNLVSDSIKPEIVFEYKIDEPILNGYDEAFNVMDKIDKNLLTKSEDIKPKRKRGRPKGIFKKSKKNTSRCKNLSLSNTRIMEGRILQELKQKKSQEMTFRCNKLSLDTTKEEILTEKLFCGLCSKSCDEKIDLIMHLESHKESRCCKQCPEHFDSWSQQLGHRLKHIPKKQMCCHLCSKRYVSCDYLEFHYRNVHFEEEGKTLTCKICFSSYTTPKNLKKHIWATHAEKRFTCDYCSKSYHSKSRLKVHIVMHTGNRAYSCDICGFKSKFYSGLKDHQIRKHTDDKVNCRICHRVFSNQQQFDRHKCGKNETVCPICGLQFKKNNNLARHLKTHSDVQKYECTRCPAKFKTRGALSVHLDRHDGIRRRQCEYCSDKFYAASTLIKHRRIHTGEKPYVCKICNKGFTGNHNLKMHMKVHGEHNLIKKKTKDPNSNEVNSLELK